MKQKNRLTIIALTAVLVFTIVSTGCDTDGNRPPNAPRFYHWDIYRTTTSSIHISWQHERGSVEYRLERASSATGPWSTLTRTSSNEFTDSGLSPNTVWYYRVIGVNRRGVEGPPSDFSVRATRKIAPVLRSVEVISQTSARVTWYTIPEATFSRINFTLNPEWIPDAVSIWTLLDLTERAYSSADFGGGFSPFPESTFSTIRELSWVLNNLPADGSGAFVIVHESRNLAHLSQPLIVWR